MPFHLDPPLGFQGLRPDLPVAIYRRHLPHWRQRGATYFTTFRLADSLPAAAVAELRGIREEWEKTHPQSESDENQARLAIELGKIAEHWLDQGCGACLFRKPENRLILENALLFFDESCDEMATTARYEMGAFVIMPNHVHCLIRPLDCEDFPLERIEGSWKRHVSRKINSANDTSGSIWFQESYDRIVRDSEHLYRCLHYIGRNPDKAGLREGEFSRWVKPEWADGGWGFRAR